VRVRTRDHLDLQLRDMRLAVDLQPQSFGAGQGLGQQHPGAFAGRALKHRQLERVAQIDPYRLAAGFEHIGRDQGIAFGHDITTVS
jgi:hypothetical protein